MYQMILEYDQPTIKPTILYNLEPIGIGTAFVESLSSYIMRLAAAHMVNVSALMKYVIADSLEFETNELGKPIGRQRFVKDINGMGTKATDMVRSLEKLTGRQDLKFLTMIPFSGKFNNSDLVNSVSECCPYCFQEQRESGIPPYIPLIWCLTPFKYCVVHGTKLGCTCPYCDTSSEVSGLSSVIGYCSRCKSWKGSQALPKISHSSQFSGANDFAIRLIGRGNEFADMPMNSTFPSMMKYLMGRKMRMVDCVAMARLMKCGESTIKRWVSGEWLPSLPKAIFMARRFNIDPMDILTSSGEEMSRRDQKVVASISYSSNLLDTVNWSQMHGLLSDVANGKASAMRVEDVARVYKCSPEQITTSYPELSIMVEARFNKMIRSRMYSCDAVTLADKVDSIVNQFVSAGVEPTKMRVKDIVGFRGLWILPLVFYKYYSIGNKTV